MRVESQWIDYNGHLNMAYYNVLFDKAVDEAYALAGIGETYMKKRLHSTFTVEVHLRYLRELHANDPVRVTFQLLDFDSKRLHFFKQLFHATEGWVSATLRMPVAACRHADQENGRLPDDVKRMLRKMKDSHARLPRPEAAGKASRCRKRLRILRFLPPRFGATPPHQRPQMPS
jgi:acyl-CoA thioester hydrolase